MAAEAGALIWALMAVGTTAPQVLRPLLFDLLLLSGAAVFFQLLGRVEAAARETLMRLAHRWAHRLLPR